MMFKTALLSLAFSFSFYLSPSALATPVQTVNYMEVIFGCGPKVQDKASADLAHFAVNLKANDREYRLPEGALKLVDRNFVLSLNSGDSVIVGSLSEDPRCEVSDGQAHGVWSSIALDKNSAIAFTIDPNIVSCEHNAEAAVFQRTELYTLQASGHTGSFSWNDVVTSASPYACEHP